MNEKLPLPIVVGIDGSDTAVNAARWAVKEAVSRDVPLRLIYVTKSVHESAEEYKQELHHAKVSLREAQKAVEATDDRLKVETAILTGPPGFALVEESSQAAMVCVGSIGIGRYAKAILGSTATHLAEKAHCPVAVIRPRGDVPDDAVDWIVVAVKHEPRDERVLEHAMREADLRSLPVLLVGREDVLDFKIKAWKPQHPHVHVYPVTADNPDVGRFLQTHHEPIHLAVIPESDASEVADILGPHGHHSLLRRPAASVLVVRS